MFSTGVLVRINGRDPNLDKHKGFEVVDQDEVKRTTAIAQSGTKLNRKHVVTIARGVIPFSRIDSKAGKIIVNAQIDVREESKGITGNARWIRSQIVGFLVPSESVRAATDLLRGNSTRRETAFIGGQGWTFVSPHSYDFLSEPTIHTYGTLAIIRTLFDLNDSLLAEKLFFGTSSAKSLERPNRGRSVRVVSSPFGTLSPAVLQNSVTSGILCNVVGRHGLYLIDARCLGGAEGGGVFVEDDDEEEREDGIVVSARVVGIVGAPLAVGKSRLLDAESVGLNVVVPYGPELANLIRSIVSPDSMFRQLVDTKTKVVKTATKKKRPVPCVDETVVEKADRSVVLLSIGTTWCSGVIVSDRGHILTVAHLLEPGVPVFCVGHALYGPSLRMRPSVTAGTISKCASAGAHSRPPSMLQTSAVVLRGHSGGALVTRDGANLVGLITSHAKLGVEPGEGDSEVTASEVDLTERHVVRMNFCVSVHAFWPLVLLARIDGRVDSEADAQRRSAISSLEATDADPRELALWELRLADAPGTFVPAARL
eukprot:g4782.t1